MTTVTGASLTIAAIITMLAISPACTAQVAPVPTQVAPVPAQVAPVTAPSTILRIPTSSLPGASGSTSRVAYEGKTLHITVGHSIFLDTKIRLRRVYVSDPTILNSVTLSPNQIIVTAMTPGVSSITLLDDAGQAQSYVISSDVDVEGLRVAMSQAMRGNAVNVEGSGGHVVLSGTVGSDAMADAAVKLATLYSKEVANALTVIPSHPKQVRLQVRILEVDRSKALQLGINLFNPGGNTSFLAATTTSQYASTATLSQSGPGSSAIGTLLTSNPLNFMLYSAKLNLGATIQDLESKQILQILAEPTITTISGQTANFLSGGEFPFPMIQPGGTGGAPVVTISFRPYGVKVEFTPVVNEDGTIRLKVAPEVSALDYTNTVTISGFTIPAISTRRASTEVELRSNQSFAISGLLDQRTTDILSKNPGAASIPILGYLFKSKNVNHSTTELVVVVTPTVVDPLAETDVPSQPDLPIPTMNIGKYDKSLGKDNNPNPAAPPITPDRPPSIPPVFPPSSPVTTRPTGAAQIAVPAQTPQSAPTLPSKPATGSVGATALTKTPTQPRSSVTDAGGSRISRPDGTLVTDVAQVASQLAEVASQVSQSHARDKPAVTSVMSSHPDAVVESRGRSMVEVMALSHEADADAMVISLKRHGYNVEAHQDPKDLLVHLEVGPFTSKVDAEAMRQRLLFDGYNATIK